MTMKREIPHLQPLVNFLLFACCFSLFQLITVQGNLSGTVLDSNIEWQSDFKLTDHHHDANASTQPEAGGSSGDYESQRHDGRTSRDSHHDDHRQKVTLPADATVTESPGRCSRDYSDTLSSGLGGRKFLVLAAIKEQLSKARLHLSETMALARLLNRTLILPQVAPAADSIRYDNPLPACAYFDADRIGEMVPWVTQRYFLEQAERSKCGSQQISIKTILRYQPPEACGMDNLSWKMRHFQKSLFSQDIDDSKRAEDVICVRNEDSAGLATREQRLLKAVEEGRGADVLVLVKFTFTVDLTSQAIRVRRWNSRILYKTACDGVYQQPALI